MNFEIFNLSDEINTALINHKYSETTPIQEEVIPIVM